MVEKETPKSARGCAVAVVGLQIIVILAGLWVLASDCLSTSSKALLWAYELGKRNFPRVELWDASLPGVVLAGADLSGAWLPQVDLSNADLRGANLRQAELNKAGLSGADLSGADLRGAKMRGADLSQAILRGADLSGANLTNAIVSDAQLAQAASLKGATMPDSSVHE